MILKNYAASDYINIVKILKTYDLLGEVDSLDNFVNSLNRREKNNLLSLNLPIDFGRKYKSLLIDRDFLKSKEYKNDLNFIKYSPNDEQRNALIKVAKNNLSQKNRYHRIDMNYIFRTCNKNIYDYLIKAATNEKSLSNKKHLYYMDRISLSGEIMAKSLCEKLCCIYDDEKTSENDLKLIELSRTNEISRSLGVCSTDYFSLNSPHHESDMKMIYEAKNDLIARYLVVIATNPLSLSSKYHNLHMSVIANAKDDITASILFHMIIDEEMQNTLYHEKELNYISNAKNEVQLKYLCKLIFDPDSRKNPLYLNNLDIIANCESVVYIKTLVKEILAESRNFEKKYKSNEEFDKEKYLNEYEIVINFTDGDAKKNLEDYNSAITEPTTMTETESVMVKK